MTNFRVHKFDLPPQLCWPRRRALHFRSKKSCGASISFEQRIWKGKYYPEIGVNCPHARDLSLQEANTLALLIQEALRFEHASRPHWEKKHVTKG